jgi:hypothetical protein
MSTDAYRSGLTSETVILQDGVLLRGSDVIPAARRALALLEGNNPFRKYVPTSLLVVVPVHISA